MRLRAPLAAGAASLVAAAPAGATIVYEKNPFRPAVYAAADDGSARAKLADGELPKISPDGTTVAYETPYLGNTRPTLRVIPAAGGTSRLLLKPVWFSFGFSPDSRTIAAVPGQGGGDVAAAAKAGVVQLRLLARLEDDRRGHGQGGRAQALGVDRRGERRGPE